ncbi:MAG: hypothetical protein IKB86_02295 [Clostridia bacterium]|nr:hypothetical protein [Clostridia bacterium]
MKKASIYKIAYIISALLAVGFVVSFGLDVYNYNAYMSSAPLDAYALVRALEFLLPSVVVFIIGLIIKSKVK